MVLEEGDEFVAMVCKTINVGLVSVPSIGYTVPQFQISSKSIGNNAIAGLFLDGDVDGQTVIKSTHVPGEDHDASHEWYTKHDFFWLRPKVNSA